MAEQASFLLKHADVAAGFITHFDTMFRSEPYPNLIDRRPRIMRLAPIPDFGSGLELHGRYIRAGDNELALDAPHGEGGHRGVSLAQRKSPAEAGLVPRGYEQAHLASRRGGFGASSIPAHVFQCFQLASNSAFGFVQRRNLVRRAHGAGFAWSAEPRLSGRASAVA
jgi:hypothetical protein